MSNTATKPFPAAGSGTTRESQRVGAAIKAGGPWWTGPMWVRCTPGMGGCSYFPPKGGKRG